MHRYNYIFVRTDLPIAHQMAQACHGALETGKRFHETQMCSPDSIIILQVKNQEELRNAQDIVEKAGIKTVAFFEPDWDYGFTSFGTEPITQDMRHHLRKFRLWKP